jgi:hypothetical protein
VPPLAHQHVHVAADPLAALHRGAPQKIDKPLRGVAAAKPLPRSAGATAAIAPHQRAVLASILWDEVDDARARHRINTAL